MTSPGGATGLNLREDERMYFGGLPKSGKYRCGCLNWSLIWLHSFICDMKIYHWPIPGLFTAVNWSVLTIDMINPSMYPMPTMWRVSLSTDVTVLSADVLLQVRGASEGILRLYERHWSFQNSIQSSEQPGLHRTDERMLDWGETVFSKAMKNRARPVCLLISSTV